MSAADSVAELERKLAAARERDAEQQRRRRDAERAAELEVWRERRDQTWAQRADLHRMRGATLEAVRRVADGSGSGAEVIEAFVRARVAAERHRVLADTAESFVADRTGQTRIGDTPFWQPTLAELVEHAVRTVAAEHVRATLADVRAEVAAAIAKATAGE